MKKTFTTLITALLLSHFAKAQSQQYLHFDRMDDFVEVPEGSKFISGSDQITMAGWFWTDELAYGQGMMAFRNGGTGDGEMYIIQLDNGILECRLIINGDFYEVVGPAFTIQPEKWQHVAWAYDGTEVTLYIDGQRRGSTAASGTFKSTDTPFALGDHISPFNFFFGGRMDEFTLWNKGLTQAEIQDMMDNELTGDEAGLQIYYKFNQGVPGEDNSSITELVSEVNSANGANGILRNFALSGNASNFLGDLDQGFQAISFPVIPNKLISDMPFQLEATASSGLDVSYEILSGPATVSGNTITLDGTPGGVVVRALQAGDGTFDPADAVDVSFQVLDPMANVAAVEVRSPIAGNVPVPDLGPIPLSAISTIDFTDLFSVQSVEFMVNGETISAKAGRKGHYTGWWTPPAYGTYSMDVVSTNNYGASSTESVTFEIVPDAAGDMLVTAGESVWLNVNDGSEMVEVELPSHVGAFDKIEASLIIDCPTGGCDPWDRVSSVHLKGHNGEWYEIIRYITPYGVACSSAIDLTDFMSILHGKVTVRFELGTQGNGFEYTLKLDYKKGTPDHAYSSIEKLWNATYPFGDPANKTPVPLLNTSFPAGAQTAKLKLVSTGHGWGDNNSGNAAEFHEDTHVIRVNGSGAFSQRNWYTCNPNPDGCQPQNGTWFNNRAGWCPGAIAQWFDFDMTPYVSGGDVEMNYVLNPLYTDFCHPNNPACIDGVTCDDCNSGFNPHLIVASHLISYGDVPMDSPLSSLNEVAEVPFSIFPNPAGDHINITIEEEIKELEVRILNQVGQVVKRFEKERPAQTITMQLRQLPAGVYLVEIMTENGGGMQKLIVQ